MLFALTDEQEIEQLAEAISASLRICDEVSPEARAPAADCEPESAPSGSSATSTAAGVSQPPPPLDLGIDPSSGIEAERFSDAGVDVRFYAVFAIGRDTRFSGVHYGEHPLAYQGLLALAGGNFGRLRWQRSFSSALAAATCRDKRPSQFAAGVRVFSW